MEPTTKVFYICNCLYNNNLNCISFGLLIRLIGHPSLKKKNIGAHIYVNQNNNSTPSHRVYKYIFFLLMAFLTTVIFWFCEQFFEMMKYDVLLILFKFLFILLRYIYACIFPTNKHILYHKHMIIELMIHDMFHFIQ